VTRLVLRKASPWSRAAAASNDPGSITAAAGLKVSGGERCLYVSVSRILSAYL
jgi:hypothetical protein